MLLKWIRDYINEKFVRGDINRNDRAGALHRAWGHVYTSFIDGDYLEFGVYKGASLIESYKSFLAFKDWIKHQLMSNEAWRREAAKEFVSNNPGFHALDTFEGMPSNDEEHPTFAEGNFLAGYGEVKELCRKNGLVVPQLCLYEGLFNDTKDALYKKMGDRKAAIINIDCDLYSSAKDVLEICEPLMQIGTVLMFDDYNAFSADNKKGERKAFREFKENNKMIFDRWFSYAYTGEAFLCVEDNPLVINK